MGIVFGLLYLALLLFFVALIIRLVFDWVQMFAREWRPRGAAMAEAAVVLLLSCLFQHRCQTGVHALHLCGVVALSFG